jgi:type III secretion protein C
MPRTDFIASLRGARCAAAVLLSIAAAWPAAAAAAEMKWDNKKISYVALQPKELRAVIGELAAQQGIGVSIDPEVKGELAPGRYELSARSMMELIGRNFGVLWYFDGRVLYVYPGTSVENAMIRLTNASPAQLQRSLERLGIADSRFPLSFDGDRVLVSGPKRYVELVRQAATDFGAETDEANGAVRVFELKYAFAENYTVTSGGREYRVPGVVNILRQAFGGEGASRAVGDGRRSSLTQRRPLDGVKAGSSIGDSGSGGATLPTLPPLGGVSGGQEINQSPDFIDVGRIASPTRGGPSFAADPRTNSIIVRDAPPRMAQYEQVIRSLDQKPRLVELEVNIIEVNADDFQQLGIDWRVVGRRGQIEVGGGGIAAPVTQPNGVTPAPNPNGDPLQSLGNIAGTVLGVVAGNRNQLFMRITALEQAGKATVSAQPKVMTLNNVEAALDATSTFYVPVQGFQDAQLFDISAGTSIRITPSIIGAGVPGAAERDNVRLLIKIEDGGLTGSNVGQLPVVQRTTINTQSLVVEGSTLMIAGYAQERESSNRNGVPGLQHVPVIGNLFKSTGNNRSRVERLFMITPRVVDLQKAERAPAVPMLPNSQPQPMSGDAGSAAAPTPNAPPAASSTAVPLPSGTLQREPAPPAREVSSPTRAAPTASSSPARQPGAQAAWALGLSAATPQPPAAPSSAPPASLWLTPATRKPRGLRISAFARAARRNGRWTRS